MPHYIITVVLLLFLFVAPPVKWYIILSGH